MPDDALNPFLWVSSQIEIRLISCPKLVYFLVVNIEASYLQAFGKCLSEGQTHITQTDNTDHRLPRIMSHVEIPDGFL